MRLLTAGGLPARDHGGAGPPVLVLHGGPGAPGSAGSLAAAIAGPFHAIEPWQRRSGGGPLTVARHVADLRAVVEDVAPAPPRIVGHSWGAMLALAFAAEHPALAGPLVLVGCGTFDFAARARMKAILETRRHLEDPQSFDAEPAEDEEPFDERGHAETWEDMVKRQAMGDFPAAFAAIRSEVSMLHGAFDPHPGTMIRDGLLPYLPRLSYREFAACGHYPWRERAARAAFLTALAETLSR